MSEYVFRAVFEDGTIIEWTKPQTWRNVFKKFKFIGQFEGYGILYCNGIPIRQTAPYIICPYIDKKHGTHAQCVNCLKGGANPCSW